MHKHWLELNENVYLGEIWVLQSYSHLREK